MAEALPLAAVTGGTGFLGRHVVQALARDGWRLRILVRRPPALPVPAGGPLVEVLHGDLEDAAALRRLVEGARAVAHVAGLTKARREAEFFAVNRDGGARLAAAVAAAAAPGARCVFVSSMAAREPQLSPYAASKRAGEDAAVAALGDSSASWVVLRPSVIYGPWDREGLALLRLARASAAPVPRAPEPRIAMVHAADAAAAVAALCRDGAPAGARFEITDARHGGYGWRELLRVLTGLMGREPPRFLPVPDGAMLAAGAAADAWAAMTGRASLFGRGKAREILHRDWGSAPERQPPPAVWTPRIGLESGLRETLDWWRAGAGGVPGMAGA
ncbi:MAG: FIG010773: NAD-dependent epimerase/dehydratase [uncultured Acetobacteraceae bacterium]|uniref:FIG010773: NAD-dependent epimerase/dehydratase n=1 Tax=uncultured Acetobacteraceae bacterium TaxID=169975 RepID=A0A6J4JGJ3_9PROT|nr:MAG: FIG010773: NAD-dependent epimerase/dehydratase [uncultured Acetobacteraceae bacterium]